MEIASVLSVHVQKNDTKEKISYKIIESVVGAKLRSKAIKDTELRKKHMDFLKLVATKNTAKLKAYQNKSKLLISLF